MALDKKKRLAWCSVIPNTIEGADSSLSAYAVEQLSPLIKDKFEIDLYSNCFSSSWNQFNIYHYLSLREKHTKDPYDIILYNLEDIPAAQFVRIASTLIPGISWFHNLYFSSHGPEPILNSPWQSIIKKFSDDQTAWPIRDGENPQEAPLAKREASLCLMPIFSNQRDLGEYRRLIKKSLGGDYLSSKGLNPIPSFYLPLPYIKTRANFIQIKQEKQKFSIGICGGAEIEYRAHKFLLAIKEIFDRKFELDIQVSWMLPKKSFGRAKELLDEFGFTEEQVKLIPNLTPSNWQELVSTLDVALHLSFSVFGQLGPYHAISLAEGQPTIITQFAAGALLPQNVVYGIDAGDNEAQQILSVLNNLLEVERNKDKKPFHNSSLIRNYAQENYAPRKIANELISILGFAINSPEYLELIKKWRDFAGLAKRDLISELTQTYSEKDEISKLYQANLNEVMSELGW